MAVEISRVELHRAVEDGRPLVLIEAMGADYFDDAHLPGAINIPSGRIHELAPRLVQDRTAHIVVYCSGIGTQCASAAALLERLGYRNVSIYVGGKEDWVEHGLPVERSRAGGP